MTTVIVTQNDIESLAEKLGEFSAVLTEREQAILEGVIGLVGRSIDDLATAAPRAALRDPAPAASELPPLSAGFREAFEHGVGATFSVAPSEAEGVNVTGGVTIEF